MYKTLDPGVRVVILKALCDIRVEVLSLAAKNLLDSWSFYCCLVLILLFKLAIHVNCSIKFMLRFVCLDGEQSMIP